MSFYLIVRVYERKSSSYKKSQVKNPKVDLIQVSFFFADVICGSFIIHINVKQVFHGMKCESKKILIILSGSNHIVIETAVQNPI